MINLSVFFFILCSTSFKCCFAKDTITFGTFLTDEKRGSLVSQGEVFELGFFSPNGGENDDKRYVGIWFYRSSPETVIWVANRDKPVSGAGGVFSISEDGNLCVSDKTGRTYWSSRVASSSGNNMTAKLSDSGNLVLGREEKEDQSFRILWQSFENPTDTFLPGMMLDENLVLTSWRSRDDPACGNFTFEQDQERRNQVIISRRSVKYWNSGVSGRFINVNEMPPTILFLLSNFTSKTLSNSSVPHLTHALYKNARLVLSVSGQIQYIVRDSHAVSSTIWAEPRDKCSVYNACGNFGSCNSKNNVLCKCLPGFTPVSPENWNAGEYSSGCERKTSTCGNVSETDMFLDLKMMKVGNPDSLFNAKSESDCKTECLNNCQCQAYLYEETVGPACWIWSEELSNLQEVYESGRNLRVRVADSDIEPTERVCETCGTNLLPYPLSTGSECGDALYDGFSCNGTDGQVMFEALNGSYRVTNIDPETRTFFVRIKDVHSCGNVSIGKNLHLYLSSPFHVMGCNSNLANFSTELISKDGVEVEIVWEPPLEPTCSSSTDCRDLRNSSCRASRDGKNRCLCNEEFRWDRFKLQCTQEGGHGAQIGRGKAKLALIIIVSLIGIGVLVPVASTINYIFCSRKKPVKRLESRRSFERNTALQRFESERHTKSLMESGQFKEEDTKGLEVPFFDLESVLSATDFFSNANKLGQGGFGVVYKGKLPGGPEIAVKRLSSGSGQGHEEFKNEVLLIAKLQHRNLVRLLGYCIEAEERMLIYEYMANKSLDTFIFDRKLCALLDWDIRFNVILGIARGLLYLHQDSRLRIIHRDLKTSNVLLDKDMNPKISDFGLARIFDANETSANTKRVVGTYGYMSPEYALDGLFSLKSDVFSFGVVVFEIISGRRNTGFFEPEQSLSLLGYAWHLWKREKALDLMEKTLSERCKEEEYLKCINVGLLCVQEDPNDRPMMSNVLFMLGSEMTTLPTPKQPAFVVRRCPSSRASSSGIPEACSQNELTVTLEAGR